MFSGMSGPVVGVPIVKALVYGGLRKTTNQVTTRFEFWVWGSGKYADLYNMVMWKPKKRAAYERLHRFT